MPAALKIYPPTCWIDGLENATCRVVSHRQGLGDVPDEVVIRVTGLHQSQARFLNGRAVYVYRGEPAQYVFAGRVRRNRRQSPESDTAATVVATDVRHDLAGALCGMYGIGEFQPEGGFNGVGYKLEFNPDGLPNRMPTPVVGPSNGTPGWMNLPCPVYRFSEPGRGSYWRWKDVLTFLLAWYVPTNLMAWDALQIDATEAFEGQARIEDLYGMPVTEAISKILHAMGLSWTVRYDIRSSNAISSASTAPQFWVVGNGVSAPLTRNLHIAPPPVSGSVASTIPAFDNPDGQGLLVTGWELDEDDTQAFNHVEIHADPDIVESTWYWNVDISPDSLTPIQADADFCLTLAQNPSQLGAFGTLMSVEGLTSARHLTHTETYPLSYADTVQVKWLERLHHTSPELAAAERLTGDTYGKKPRAADNVYIRSHARYTGTTLINGPLAIEDWRRVKSGFVIDFDRGVISFQSTVMLYPHAVASDESEPEEFDMATAVTNDDVEVAFTVASRMPRNHVGTYHAYYFPPGSQAMPGHFTRIVRLRRTGRYGREDAMIHDPLVADGYEDGHTVFSPTAEVLETPTTDMEARMVLVLQQMRARWQATLQLSRAPAIYIGDAVSIVGHDPGFPADDIVRVVSVSTDYEHMKTAIRVANSML